MSFILDSLKRAEAERRQGETPAADPLYGERRPTSASRRPRIIGWTFLVLANLTVVVLLAVVLLQRRPVSEAHITRSEVEKTRRVTIGEYGAAHPAASAPAQAPEYDVPSQVVETTTRSELRPVAARSVLEPPTQPASDQPDAKVRFGPPVSARAEEIRTPLLAASNGHPVDAPEVLPPSGPAAFQPPGRATAVPTSSGENAPPALETEILSPGEDPPPGHRAETAEAAAWVRASQPHEVRPQPSSSSTDPVAVAFSAPSPAQQDRPVPPEMKSESKAPSPSAAPDDDVPSLHEMPPDIRAMLGRVKINVLIYADREEARMVYIDSRRYRTGDRIGAEGYLLERILPDGIILDYGDGRVKLGSRY